MKKKKKNHPRRNRDHLWRNQKLSEATPSRDEQRRRSLEVARNVNVEGIDRKIATLFIVMTPPTLHIMQEEQFLNCKGR